jgi:hypothetical protein
MKIKVKNAIFKKPIPRIPTFRIPPLGLRI